MAKRVRDAMTGDPRSIGTSEPVVDAARLMREQHVGSLPVTDNEKLVGMITDRDITTRVVAEAADPKMISVEDVYSRDLSVLSPTKTSRCLTAAARRRGPSSSRNVSGSGSRPRTHSEHRPQRE